MLVTFTNNPDSVLDSTTFKGKVNLGNVNITGGSITGITPLAIAWGGTGAGDALTACHDLFDNTGFTLATVNANDRVLIQDTTASNVLKYLRVSDITGSVASDTFAADSGSVVLAPGGTLTLHGATGISTSASGTTITFTPVVATTTVLGIASFSTTNFTVTSGAVSLNNLTFNADTGSVAFTAGGSMTISGGTYNKATASGSTITVDVHNSNLTAIGGLTSAANQLPYFTGSGTAALTSLTSQARTFLADSTAATQLATVGGAPVGSAYVTIGNDATLTAERALTAGSGIGITDGGANSTATVGLNARYIQVNAGTSQTIADSTYTKVKFDTIFRGNPTSDFDAVTNYRFTPTQAGKFMISASIGWSSPAAAQNFALAAVYLNGSLFQNGGRVFYANTNIGTDIVGIVPVNGTTDYIEIFIFQTTGSNATTAAGASFFTSWYIGT